MTNAFLGVGSILSQSMFIEGWLDGYRRTAGADGNGTGADAVHVVLARAWETLLQLQTPKK